MKKKSILIVQHSASKREALTSVLRRNGFHVSSVDEGTHALHMLQDEKFELVIVVDHMEDMPGQELIGLIKNTEKDTKTIMVSSLPDQYEEDFAKQVGCDLYMADYSDKNILLKAIKGLL